MVKNQSDNALYRIIIMKIIKLFGVYGIVHAARKAVRLNKMRTFYSSLDLKYQ